MAQSELKLNIGEIAPGMRFGKLTVLELSDTRRNGYRVWNCRCDCGRRVQIPSRALRGGKTDCGCGKYGGAGVRRDLTGQRFGKLTVLGLAPTESGSGRRLWKCRCDCGGTVLTTAGQLNAGNVKSCGCLARPGLKDWVGKRFGHLTVTAYDGRRNGKHFWRCICDCGNETVVNQSNLQSGHSLSCGCMARKARARHLEDGSGTDHLPGQDPVSGVLRHCGSCGL